MASTEKDNFEGDWTFVDADGTVDSKVILISRKKDDSVLCLIDIFPEHN